METARYLYTTKSTEQDLTINITILIPLIFSAKKIGGYWENWLGALTPGAGTDKDASYYAPSVAAFTHVYYSFLTLDSSPNPSWPNQKYWDGNAIYESYTGNNVLNVMQGGDDTGGSEG